MKELKFPQLLTLEYNTRFYSFTDTPDGSGTYHFNQVTNELQLNYEEDLYGSPSGTFIHAVEYLGTDKLITAITYADGSVSKKEYTRLQD